MSNRIQWNVDAPLLQCPPTPLRFKEMFLEGEAGDDETTGLAALLTALQKRYSAPFAARNVASFLNPKDSPPTDAAIDMLALLVRASGDGLPRISSETVSSRLKKLINAPVRTEDKQLLVLRFNSNKRDAGLFSVEILRGTND